MALDRDYRDYVSFAAQRVRLVLEFFNFFGLVPLRGTSRVEAGPRSTAWCRVWYVPLKGGLAVSLRSSFIGPHAGFIPNRIFLGSVTFGGSFRAFFFSDGDRRVS